MAIAATWRLTPVAAALPPLPDLDQLAAAAAQCQSGQSAEPFHQFEILVRQSSTNAAVRRATEGALVTLLNANPSVEARRFACKQLAVVGGSASLGALDHLLQSDDTAGFACLALTTYPPGKADAILRRTLDFAGGRTRVQILNTLGDRHDPDAVALLAEFARGSDSSAAEAAIAALGKIANSAAAKALAGLSGPTDPILQNAVAEAALRVAEQRLNRGERAQAKAAVEALLAASPPLAVRRRALAALLPLDGDGGEARTLQVLRGPDTALHPIAIGRVAALADTAASRIFSMEIYHLAPAEQALLVDSLAARADVDARLTISTCLSSTVDVVRRAAIDAIGRIGDAWYVPMLAHALAAAKSPEETRALENALAGLPGAAATDKAITSEISRASGTGGAALMAALVRRIGLAANPILISQLEQIDPIMAKFAFRSLGQSATPEQLGNVLQALVMLRDPAVRPDAQAAVEKLVGRMPDLARRSILLREALGRADYLDSRASLLGLLPVAADAPALATVKAATTDPEPKIREAAMRALGDWPDLGAWDTLAACYRQTDREALRWIAMRGMVRLVDEENAHPSPQFIEHYRQLVAGAHTAVDLKVILGALPGAAHPEALQIAVSMLANPDVKVEAELAVRKIAEAIKAQHPAAAEDALRRLSPAVVTPPATAPASPK